MGDLGCGRMLWPEKGGVIFAHSDGKVKCLSHENIVLIKKDVMNSFKITLHHNGGDRLGGDDFNIENIYI